MKKIEKEAISASAAGDVKPDFFWWISYQKQHLAGSSEWMLNPLVARAVWPFLGLKWQFFLGGKGIAMYSIYSYLQKKSQGLISGCLKIRLPLIPLLHHYPLWNTHKMAWTPADLNLGWVLSWPLGRPIGSLPVGLAGIHFIHHPRISCWPTISLW